MQPDQPLTTQTDARPSLFLELSDAGGNQVATVPPRSLAAWRQIVRERVKVYGAPLPDGFVLPDGITLEMLLGDDPKPKN
jgi:hypothetical protein